MPQVYVSFAWWLVEPYQLHREIANPAKLAEIQPNLSISSLPSRVCEYIVVETAETSESTARAMHASLVVVHGVRARARSPLSGQILLHSSP